MSKHTTKNRKEIPIMSMLSVMRSRLKMLFVTFCLVIIFTSHIGVHAINPLKDPTFCGIPTCDIDNDNEKFHYLPNTIYKYLYESSFQTLFDGTDSNDPSSELYVSAAIELSFPSKCQGLLKVSSAQLKYFNISVHNEVQQTGDYEYETSQEQDEIIKQDENSQVDPKTVLHSRSSEFSKDVEKFSMRFDFRDGLIQEICPDNDESVWVTNFKRGILSALQNTMYRLDLDQKSNEIDVSGKCDVKYEFIGAVSTSIKINKTKDISSCQNRNKFKSIIQTTPYEFRKSGISWWPIYNSSSFCELSIDNYVYNNIECHERHVLIPFSNEYNGAVSKSFMRMKLIGEQNSTNNDDIYIETRRTLLYDHSVSPKPVHNDIKLSREYLRQMCTLGFPNIQREFPDKFVKFLTATKQLSEKGLTQLLARAGGICKNGRKHVLESLPYIESSASVEIMKNILTGKIKSKELTNEIKESWMISMFYLPRPDDKIIETMFSLIQFYEQEPNPMYILIPSSVAHTYCENQYNCMQNYVIQNIIKYLENMVSNNIAGDLTDKATYEKLLVAMKGLGNIGFFSDDLEKEMLSVIIDESYSDDVKLQAIQLFRKTDCENTREYFKDIYKNFTQSVEIRIASYLQMMKCPSYLTIKNVKSFLKYEEQVNQVGSFVWSHLMNVAKTSSPQKIELQALLVDEDQINDKFRMDFRKFSKNYEQSLFFDEYNFGITGESNVIFGIESYIPRSISFNGTVNLFGGSMNPFEFNIRLQGLENYIESIFGIDAPLNFEKLVQNFKFIYDKVKSFIDIDEDIIGAILRTRRSTDNQIEGFGFKPNYDFNKPKGYFEHKIFGNDINFYRFEGLDELSDLIKKLVPIERVKNIFSNRKEVFIDSGTFVDVSYTVPSSTGFPLVLNGFGAYSLDITYFASINNDKVWETKMLDFTGKLRPSLSLELNANMQMDLFYSTTEVKFKSNIYSNYALDSNLKIKDYTHASLKVEVPQDRNDIFSIRTELISKIEGRDSFLNGINNRFVNSSCTWPTIDETVGLKMCIDYSLPDVSDQSKNYPSLILSGPIIFDIHLDKADLSAKIFTFDYNWKSANNKSEGSIIFETPNSKIPRKLSAILLMNPTDSNFTMKLINGKNIQKFLGLYKNTPELSSFDFSISQNGQKHLQLEMSVEREIESKSKRKLIPQFLLTIQGQKLAGIKGIIEVLDKNDVRQYDFELNCETKKLQSGASGTLTLTDVSMRLNTKMQYRFAGQKEETVDILMELANRSQRLTEYIGSLKFQSSAYKNFNFYSNSSFISSMGHAELRVDYNNAPDFENPAYTLSTKITLARNTDLVSETTFAIEITRPLSDIDLKFYVKYDELYKNGTEHTAVVLVRYSTNKEIVTKVSVFIPKGNLFGFDATFLLTVPDLGTCSSSLKIQERMQKNYLIDLQGAWFSNETIKVLGSYQDRTSNVKQFYKVKAIISSNQFNDVNVLLRYSRDVRELKIDVKTEYNDANYSFLLESTEPEPLVLIFKTELNWADKKFSINSNSSSKDIGRTKIEIHLDRLRDVHLEIWGLARSFSKNVGIEFKWDANRDPTQRLIFSYEVDKPEEDVYVGNILMSYPERTVNGDIHISNKGPYTGKMKISWSSEEIVETSYSVGADFKDYNKLWAVVQINTPFPGWKSNNINGTIYQHGNLFSANLGTIWAENQNIALEFFNDYLLNDKEISCELRASVQSTLTDIPAIIANFKYNQTTDDLDTVILLKHKNLKNNSEFQTFSMKSAWKRNYDSTYRNISGTVLFMSPYSNYTSGALVTKFSLTKDRSLYGVIDMDIDARLYSFSVEGYLKKFFDNMISFNVSTPIETFPSLLGKFGIVEHKKYFIADLKTPNKSLGIEVLFDFVSITNFDMKFYAATPQPSLEKILAIGKIRDSIMHIEGAWNKVTLGFRRVSHFKDVSDFEYSYQVFTPLQNFETNGIVMKFIADDIQNFDVEASFKLGKQKLGIKGFGEPKKQLITQLGLQKASYIREDLTSTDELDSEENDETKIDINFDEYYSLSGNFEICTIVWSPITGHYDIQQIDDTYHSEASILIPKGVVTVSNKLVVRSTTDFMNRLKIDTPILQYQSVNSNFKLKVPNEGGITARFDVGIKNKSKWKNYGFKLNYALPKSSQSRIHDVSLIILYPLMNTSKINVNTRLELSKKGLKQANFTLDGFNTRLDMSGFFDKIDKNFDSGFNVKLNSPILNNYVLSSYAQKTTVLKDNQINVGFLHIDDGIENKFDTDLFYRLDSNHVIDGYLSVKSNIFPIEKFNTSVYISEGIRPKFDVQIQYGREHESMNQMKFLISKDGNSFEGEALTPFKELKTISFVGNLIEGLQPGSYKAKGKLFKDTANYDFEGDVVLQRNFPHHADLIFTNENGQSKLNYIISVDELKRSIKANLSKDDDFVNFESELFVQDLLDWAYNIKVISSHKDINELKLSTSLTPIPKNQYEASFEMTTPWKAYSVDKINVSSVVNLNPADGSAQLFYLVSQHSGNSEYSWKWVDKQQKQNYELKLLVKSNDTGKHFNTEFSFVNPQKAPADVSFFVDINSLWKLSTGAKYNLVKDQSANIQDMSIVYDLSLPKPIESNHKIEARYKGNNFPPQLKEKSNTDWFITYSNQALNTKLKFKGAIDSYSNMTNEINLEWGDSTERNQIGSDFTVSNKNDKTFYKWELETPTYKDEKTLIVNANYAKQDDFNFIHTDINYPESKQVTKSDIIFTDMQNTKGAINSSLPIFNVSWFNFDFDFESQDSETTKFIKATWPDNHALIDSKSTYLEAGKHKEWKGTIKAEIPLQSKHNIQVIYGLEEKPLITTGDATVDYNSRTVLNSHYTCKTEQISANHNKEIIDLSLENEKRPLGIHYTHEMNKNPNEKLDYSMKRLEFFDLSKENNVMRFNITSEFTVEIRDNKQKYKFVAIHPNRTITWTSDYTSLTSSTQQSSKIALSEDVWLEYDFNLSNLTSSDSDGQQVNFAISYPGRKVSARANYETKSDSIKTNVNLQWDKKGNDGNNENNEDQEDEESNEFKSVEGSFQWKDLSNSSSDNHQFVMFALKHPKFEKDVTVQGSYFRNKEILGKIEIDVDYTEEESHHAKFLSIIENLSEKVGYKNYTIHVNGNHEASELNLFLNGSLGLQQNYYKMEANGNYKRGYLPDMELELLSFVDLNQKEIKFYRHTPNKDIDVYTILKPQFPAYSIEGIYIDSPDYEMAGSFVIDLKKKTVNSDVKLSADETQKFQIRGIIPDTRSATLNIWRDYDDIRIDDMSYFIQMNHSRLITSKMLWRPKLKKELKTNIKNFMVSRYLAMAEEIEYWVKTYYTETKDTITGVFAETEQYLIPFRDDMAALKDIDEDLLKFKNFLNESYYNDDFYVQSLMNYTFTVLDELSITNHIADIPKIFKEIWEALGESSDAFKKSIFWIINLMKTSYKDTVDTFNKLVHGSLTDYVTQFLNNIIENYDRFVKNLHITFMNSIEAMWDNMAQALSNYWNRILESIEPQILRSIHYVETTLWTVSAEIFDFMYNRTNEFMESPYFVKVSNITHDLDVLYQDIQRNDLFTNFKKYSSIMYKFLKEKILRVMPFGKELRIISEDISVAYKEIRQIEFVKEYFDHLDEIEANLQWLVNEFQLEKRLGALFEILKKKLNRITQSALETEDIYREAKTKFIFDPHKGVIEWEQKLPVAWHAFNETPQFEEIPEYKFFLDTQDFLFTSKNSSFNFFYGLMLSEPQNFVLPFKSYALLIGSRHIFTYDKSNIEINASEFGEYSTNSETLNDQCSYLLAHDFVDERFSIILKPASITEKDQKFMSKSLLIKSKNSKVEIELGNSEGEIKIGDRLMTILPKQSGDMLVTRDHNIVIVKSSKGFAVTCNLEFDVCLIELSGWYFGKIGGILGTMNNENFDDLTKSDNEITDNQNEFIESWRTTKECSNIENSQVKNSSTLYEDLQEKCNLFFKRKTSYVASCFSVIDPTAFYDMCLNLGTLPIYQLSSKSVEKAACTSVISYIEACSIQNIPLRIPDACIYCNLPNNTHVNEGTFVKLKDEAFKPTADIVFLAEAKECNTDTFKKSILKTLVSSITTEFKLNSINDVQFSLMSFGGSNEFMHPEIVTSNGKIFTSAQNIYSYFDHIKASNQSSMDVLTAITKASKLIFRPGALKIFVLSLCGNCEIDSLKFDFKSIGQLLRENDIILHILSNEALNSKKILGIDNLKAYLRKDQTKLNGDEKLRKTIKIPKAISECESLTRETEGSIFLTGGRSNANELKILANVFAKRVANVHVKPCHICECEGHNSGTAYLTCVSCENLPFKDIESMSDYDGLDLNDESDYDDENS